MTSLATFSTAVPFVLIREHRCVQCGSDQAKEISTDCGFSFTWLCDDCTTTRVNKARMTAADVTEFLEEGILL